METADIGTSTANATTVRFPITFNNTLYHQIIQIVGSADGDPSPMATARISNQGFRVSQKVKIELGAHCIVVGY